MDAVPTTPIDLLITNDDGVRAVGLEALRAACDECFTLLTVAPLTEMSGVSHAITLERPLRLTCLDENSRYFAVDGTPADCVYLARVGLLKGVAPRMTLSGINLGPNLGEDTIYSGTVAGAREAAIWGIPAIALSSAARRPRHLDAMGRLARDLATVLFPVLSRWPDGTLLSVNFPDRPDLRLDDLRVTRLGRRRYGQAVTVGRDPRGKDYYWIGGAAAAACEGGPEADCSVIAAGNVSCTPLQLDQSGCSDGVRILRDLLFECGLRAAD